MANNPVVRFCKVASVTDDTGRDMITVHIDPTSAPVKAFPLLPKLFYVKPKQNEGVFVLFTDASNTNSPAYYLGPVISQEHEMDMDSYDNNSAIRGSRVHPDVNPKMSPEIKSLIPKNDEVWVRGRKNAEIQLTDTDVRLRAGVRQLKKQTTFNPWGLDLNQKNPAFAKFKFHSEPLNSTGVQSTATIVADKINLISNNSPITPPIDGNDLIKDEDLKNFLEDGYKLPYGEKLVNLLKAIINAICSHTHNYIMLPPVVSPTIAYLNTEKAELLDNEALLSDTVRIN